MIQINVSSAAITDLKSSENFTINFNNPLVFQDGKYEMALMRAEILFGWSNISPKLNNDTLRYTNAAGTLRVITILRGQYETRDINNFLHQKMTEFGDFTIAGDFDINIIANFSTGKIEVFITDATLFTLDLTVGDLNLLLGFAKVVLSAQLPSHVAPNLANITNGVNSLLLSTNVTSSSFINGNTSNVLSSIPITAGPHELIEFSPPSLIWLAMELDIIQKIDIVLTDQSLRGAPVLDNQLEDVSYTIVIRKRRDQEGIILNK